MLLKGHGVVIYLLSRDFQNQGCVVCDLRIKNWLLTFEKNKISLSFGKISLSKCDPIQKVFECLF
jgi:hypothetical protein